MIAGSLVRVAFSALRANKLRSGLTLLGVIFGVTSVMTIISALEGMMGAIEEDLGRLGPSTFMVSRIMVAMSNEEFFEKLKRKPITVRDAELIADGCELCDKVSPRAFTRARLKYRDKAVRRVDIMAGTANIIDIVDIQVAQGRFHSTEDDLYRRPVVFIGDQIREELFAGMDPMGKALRINGRRYRVIGLAKRRGSMFGESQDNFVIIPLSCYLSQFGRPRGINVVIKAVSVERLDEAMDEVRVILRSKRKVAYNEPDDFDMMTAENILDLLNQITKIFRFGLIGISSISLVVGGIVVMNIMMVSVTERTREIGIRKSVGAKQNHILLQFVFESTLLTLSGGLVGIVLGFFIAQSLVAMIDMQIAPSALAIIAGLSISTGIGLIFGIYPAMRAARLDPVKALSYE
ncbi:MAG TPA: ABC transporter permease [Acidobacteriota bacterium]|nr:ABC transporter permease [Acidobacteriota bacterium]